ncbi:MAG: transposase [Stenomitos frigidus ULC029]
MKAYSIDLREKIVQAYEQGNTSVRKVAARFGVAKSFVQKLLVLKQTQGHVVPRKQGGALKSVFEGAEAQLAAMVEKYPDATLLEYCEYWGVTYQQWVSSSTMCRRLQKQKLTLKKDFPQQPSTDGQNANVEKGVLATSPTSRPRKPGFH